jgi:hypothetical protein
VLRKCANPVCYVPFRYLHQGKLFEVEIQYSECPCGKGTSSNGKRYVERYWLCDQCAAHIALQPDSQRGVVLISSLEESREVATTLTLQFHPRGGAEIARVLIRPSDLTLTLSKRRKAASGLETRRRKTL